MMFFLIAKFFLIIKYIVALIAIIVIYRLIRKKPTNNANWAPDQKILAYADIIGSKVNIHNIRNFKYNTETDYVADYYDKSVDIGNIKTLDFVFVPYSKFKILAHTFLTFGFEDGSHIAISVEIRKKIGQNFSSFKSLFKQYELMYVVADENDVIKLRTNYRHEPVHLYPMNATKEQIQKMFLSMLERANQLKDKPEFYNPFTNTCTTNIANHIRKITPQGFPFSFKVILPGYSEELAYDLGIINTNLPYADTRRKFFINDKAIKSPDALNFSVKIRM